MALERFEQGVPEIGMFLYDEHKYRYMAPLNTEKGCLKCHAEQGYKLGDIRGGISVTQPAKEILHNREHTITNTLIIHLIVFVLSGLALIFYGRSQQRLQQLRVGKEGAEQANAFKGAFIANISHELRTPLSAIMGMSHILKQEGLNTAQQAHVLCISEAGTRLNTMINHMLDFSRVDVGAMALTLAPLQLRQVVQESIELMQGLAQKKGLYLSADFQEDLPQWLQGDAQHIHQVLFHILDNAIKFTDAGGVTVSVSAAPENETHYRVSILIERYRVGHGKIAAVASAT